MIRKVYEEIRAVTVELRREHVSAHAAGTAFFLFLSLVPMLIFVCAVLPYTPLTAQNLKGVLTDLTPEVIDPVVETLVEEVYGRSGGVLSLAIIATIWSAAKGVMALMNGLNDIAEMEEKRNYFVVRAVASFYTVLVLIVMIFSLILVVFGNRLVVLLLYHFPDLQGIVDLLMHCRFVFVGMFLTILFATIYAYIPNRKMRFGRQLPGAIFAAGVWSVFSWGFSLYLDWPGTGNLYGSLSIIVFMMLWMYFGMYILLLGAYLNKHTEHLKKHLERSCSL